MTAFDGMKVFSATMARDRQALGETVTNWLRGNPGVQVVDKQVNQSSDAEYHCLSVVLFYRGEERQPEPRRTRR